ncbi:MAG: sigma-54-dependent Fis family transcriptional regulator [Pseudomonadota bacterium]
MKPATPNNGRAVIVMPRTPGKQAPLPPAAEQDDASYDEQRTMRAWENFLTGDASVGSQQVRNIIRNSWARSATSGVNAHASATPLVIDDDQLDRSKQQRRSLLAAADHALQHAADLLEETSAMVVLTDENGVILDTRGDGRTLDAGHDIKLQPGGHWNEDVVGTNGIGTALSTGKPVFVHAAEHFCQGIKSWTCAGAPIRDPVDQSIIGLIDISGPPEIFRRHNIALAVLAAEKIELALGEHARIERLRLLEACLSSMPVTDGADGLVVLDRHGRIIHLNGESVPKHVQAEDGVNFNIGRRLVDLRDAATEQEIYERLPMPLRPAWVKPLKIGSDMSGAMLIYAAASRARTRSTPPAPTLKVPEPPHPEIQGESVRLLHAISKAKRAASSRVPVLVEGETGVGKELFAKLIHSTGQNGAHGSSSPNRQDDPKAPFIAFNCGAVSKDLLGAELFGHVAGAFTGAARDGRAGRFELASGGTLCLDEIGEMPLDLQPYLLRVLEEGAVYRLGDGKPRPVDVRLVALTNRNLKDEVAAGRFRRDLYFRISTVTIEIPPLRERMGDIDRLIDHFNHLFAIKYGVEQLTIEPDARQALRDHDWPGNVRELRNLIESLTLMSTERNVRLVDLPEDMGGPGAPQTASPMLDGGGSLEDTERQAIEQAIEAGGGNLSLVAKTLKISRSTLYRKMRHYGLER